MVTENNNEEDVLATWIEQHPATVIYIAIVVTLGLVLQLIDLFVAMPHAN